MHNPPSHVPGKNLTNKPAMSCPFAAKAGAPAFSLADTLKESTKAAHAKAETHAIQGELVRGTATRAQYAAWLGQMLPVWRAVDAGLSALAARDPRVGAMVKPYHPHAHRLEADMRFLVHSEDAHPPVAATTRFVDMVTHAATSGGPSLLGVWYVLEGSTNGGRYIAKALSRSLSIAGPEGLTSLDPHGESQRERWQAWRADLDRQSFTDAERDAIIAAANATFVAVYETMEDMMSERASIVA